MFYDEKFWSDSGVVKLLVASSAEKPFVKLVYSTDSIDRIVQTSKAYRANRNLPVTTKHDLLEKYWERHPHLAEKKNLGTVQPAVGGVSLGRSTAVCRPGGKNSHKRKRKRGANSDTIGGSGAGKHSGENSKNESKHAAKKRRSRMYRNLCVSNTYWA